MTDATVFDLASLTKPLATTLSILCLIKDTCISLDDSLDFLLEKEVPLEKKNITLRHLLNHCSGFPDYIPYFYKLAEFSGEQRKKILQSWVVEEPLVCAPGEKSIYSDLGFMVLGWIVEKKSGMTLEQFVFEKILKPLGLQETVFFQPLHRKKKERHFAATEKCAWRNRVVIGEVHDYNTHAVGGVSGQAGLFGDIRGVLELTTALLDQWQGRSSHPNYRTDDLKTFLERPNRAYKSTWALGFDTPSEKGSSSGRYFSKRSVGHLGFTGTSFWIDPEKDLVVVLLTNRVHPDKENNRIKEFRPLFHDTVVELLQMTGVQ